MATGEVGRWEITSPQPVGDLATLFSRLRRDGEAVALGVDFPLGLPRIYAARHVQVADFPSFLRELGQKPQFFDVCDTLTEVTPDRPFYPRRGVAGMTRLSHALALDLTDATGLSRLCDRATAERPAGAPLFWTLGANQSGKAAISAWRDLLIPALKGPAPPALWPFDGPFRALLRKGAIAVAETYPAEALRQLGIRLSGSKRRQGDRTSLAPAFAATLTTVGAIPSPSLASEIAAGFGGDPAGEDRFDSVVGLLCVLAVIGGLRPDTAPADPWVQRWEGWVLGQTALPTGVPCRNEGGPLSKARAVRLHVP